MEPPGEPLDIGHICIQTIYADVCIDLQSAGPVPPEDLPNLIIEISRMVALALNNAILGDGNANTGPTSITRLH